MGQTARVTAPQDVATIGGVADALRRAGRFPRLRYMGSKYRLLPHLAEVFAEVGGSTAVDPFSGSGVVSYLLKCMGYQVTSGDYLNFPTAIARATVVNNGVRLTADEIHAICGPPADARDLISTTFDGLYFTAEDRRFLDSAWSHVDRLPRGQRDLAISALVLSAARRQPRGVFTFTDASRYTDGRRDLTLSLREHFRERAAEYNAVVFDGGHANRAVTGHVGDVDAGPYDLVYLDPPYAPPADDNDYLKRYHFLEGLSVYWRGATIMENTRTKKLEKRFTPFAYKRTIEDALLTTFQHFADSSAIVLSYSSNAIPGAERVVELLGRVKKHVEIRAIDHRYSFGTHGAATRRSAQEYLFIGWDG